MKISKEKIIIIFYILYFTWLLMITYLTRNILIINYFSIAVTAFYFLLLREKNDIILFTLSGIFSIVLTFYITKSMEVPNDLFDLSVIPLWLPLAWGVTIVSLKKFGLMMMYD